MQVSTHFYVTVFNLWIFHCSLLEQKQLAQFDQYKKSYADILYKWGLLNQRAELLKYISATEDNHEGVGTFFDRYFF